MLIQDKLPQLSNTNNHNLIDNLKYLLACLNNPKSCKQAILYLHEFYNKVKNDSESYSNFNLSAYELTADYSDTKIKLFVNDAVFIPELWGKTFAEGLLKQSSLFKDKTVAELGTGTGWISFLLLLKTDVKFILALDINSIAVLLANLNLWLNGTNPNGDFILRENGINFVDSFKAVQSDLLNYPISESKTFDLVIGCIPQVIHPDTNILDIDNSSNKELLDLSNYCFRQGIIEDYFGLPLIARASEQSQLVLNKSGKLILVIGGRPGKDIIETMFLRRGLIPKIIWSRRIPQAADTSIDTLVEVENNQNIKFHFYISPESNESISANLAKLIIDKKKPVYHDLSVYQSEPLYNNNVLKFIKSLNSLGMTKFRSEFDFSSISEESLKFCNHLIKQFDNSKQIPYPHEYGSLKLRQNIARFLQNCCNFSVSANNLFIGPERKELLSIIFKFLKETKSSVLMSENLVKTYKQALINIDFTIIEANNELPVVCNL